MIYWFEQKIPHFVENQKAESSKKSRRELDEIRESYHENTGRLIYLAILVTMCNN